jgi:hypothetical protein
MTEASQLGTDALLPGAGRLFAKLCNQFLDASIAVGNQSASYRRFRREGAREIGRKGDQAPAGGDSSDVFAADSPAKVVLRCRPVTTLRRQFCLIHLLHNLCVPDAWHVAR